MEYAITAAECSVLGKALIGKIANATTGGISNALVRKMAAGGIRHGIESGVTMVTQGFRDATLYHMSAKDTLHDVGITGITTFGTGIAFDILSRPVQALVRKFRGTVGISGCSEAAEGAGKSAGGTSDSPYIPDDEDIALEKMYDEQGKPCEEYEDYLNEIRKHIDEPAPKVKRKGGGSSVDYYVGPNGKVLPSQYKDWIGTNIQEELLRQAENPQLKNAIKQLYRGKSFIGDGGTADVIKFEQKTGIMLGKNGGAHIQKGIDMASYLQNKILSQELSATDKQLATKLLKDLNNALGR